MIQNEIFQNKLATPRSFADSVNCFTNTTRTSASSPRAYVTEMLAGARYKETKAQFDGMDKADRQKFRRILGDLSDAFENDVGSV